MFERVPATLWTDWKLAFVSLSRNGALAYLPMLPTDFLLLMKSIINLLFLVSIKNYGFFAEHADNAPSINLKTLH